MIGINFENTSRIDLLTLNRNERQYLKGDIKRYSFMTAGSEIRKQFLKSKDVLAITIYPNGIVNSVQMMGFHASLLIITRAREVFIFDPEICINHDYYKRLSELVTGLRFSKKTEIKKAFGDQRGENDCLFRALEMAAMDLWWSRLQNKSLQIILIKLFILNRM